MASRKYAFDRVLAGTEHQRRALKARKWREKWIETGCDRLMLLSDFKQTGKRNRIRRELKLEPIFVAGEVAPSRRTARQN